MNRNIKRLDIRGCTVVAGVDTSTTTVLNNIDVNALQTLHISTSTTFTEEAAREIICLVLHPSNQNLVELELGSIVFGNDSVVASEFFDALLGKATIKRLTVDQGCLSHFNIVVKVATKVEALSVDIGLRDVGEANPPRCPEVLTRTLPKMKHLLELNLSCTSPLSEEAKNKFVRSVEQHSNLTTMTLRDPHNRFSPAQHQKLRMCGNRNVMLRELLIRAGKEDQPVPPQVPRFLTTCHNCPTAALALLVSLKAF